MLASDLARYASFFKPMKTYGISRDDINSFYLSYTQYDVISENPFMFLSEPVKDLLLHAISSGRIVRPDLNVSLCGEQGSELKDIEFCIKNKFNSISCSTFKVPLAKLAIAKYCITTYVKLYNETVELEYEVNYTIGVMVEFFTSSSFASLLIFQHS